MPRLTFEPEAETDIIAAADWYDSRGPNLRSEFLSALEHVLAKITDNPEQYGIVEGDIRKARLGRFPYLVIYRFRADEIVIAACVHGHRHPSSWRDRLPP